MKYIPPSQVVVSVVVISWKMRQMLRELLGSLQTYTEGISYEIIVVDNDSRDGTYEMLQQDFPNVQVIKNRMNSGVAPARNQAFKVANGKFVVSLDADMVFRENSLKALHDFMESHPDAGICSCKLTYPDGVVQPNARRYPSPLAFIMRRLSSLAMARESRTLRYHEIAEWDRADVRTVDYVIGACQFIRREAMQQVGLLDENIFYGPEDIDYCLRMYRAGWKVYFTPETSIVHYEQRITKKKFFSRITWRHFKGVLYLFVKYNGRLSR